MLLGLLLVKLSTRAAARAAHRLESPACLRRVAAGLRGCLRGGGRNCAGRWGAQG
jgi:hypothetical protein